MKSETLKLTRDDFIIDSRSATGYSSSSDNGITVGLSTELDDKLLQEGIVRDVIRQIQIFRKDAGFEVEDRIHLFSNWSTELLSAISENKDYFCAETLTVTLNNYSKDKEFTSNIIMKDKKIPVSLSRAKNK